MQAQHAGGGVGACFSWKNFIFNSLIHVFFSFWRQLYLEFYKKYSDYKPHHYTEYIFKNLLSQSLSWGNERFSLCLRSVLICFKLITGAIHLWGSALCFKTLRGLKPSHTPPPTAMMCIYSSIGYIMEVTTSMFTVHSINNKDVESSSS